MYKRLDARPAAANAGSPAAMNSGPLSLRMRCGTPRIANNSASVSITSSLRDAAIHLQRQALPRVLIHDRQPLQRAAAAVRSNTKSQHQTWSWCSARRRMAGRWRSCPTHGVFASSAALSALPAATAAAPASRWPATLRGATTPRSGDSRTADARRASSRIRFTSAASSSRGFGCVTLTAPRLIQHLDTPFARRP